MTSSHSPVVSSDRTVDIWGERTPNARDGHWPERVDQFLTVDEGAVERWVQSACVLCSNGCGMDVAVAGGRIVGVRGRVEDRVNRGRLGPKGLYGWQANHSPDRLTRPLIRVDGELRETDWDTAMNAIVQRSQQVIDEHTRLAMAFYTSGQLFAEEYYTLAVLARGGIGTPHLDGNTRLCTATAEWALVESFGSDGDPGSYTDIARATPCSWSGTTWPRRRRSCGCGCWTGCTGRTVRSWSSSTLAGRRWPRRPTSTWPSALARMWRC